MNGSVDVGDLASIAQAIEDYPEQGEKALRLALTSAARKGLTLGVDAIYQRKALSKAYIRSNFTVRGRPSAGELRIIANQRPVLLSRYGAQIRTVPAKTPARYLKGDAARGIPRGRKAAGAKGLRFNRGDAKQVFRHVFFVRLQGSGRWEPAERTGPGRNDYKVLHGMSVAQAWEDSRDSVAPELLDYTAAEFNRQFLRLS